jgi:hypothetical protein
MTKGVVPIAEEIGNSVIVAAAPAAGMTSAGIETAVRQR